MTLSAVGGAGGAGTQLRRQLLLLLLGAVRSQAGQPSLEWQEPVLAGGAASAGTATLDDVGRSVGKGVGGTDVD